MLGRVNYPSLLNELKYIGKEYVPLLPKELRDQYKDLLQTQQTLKQDKAFNAAARLVRFLHIRYDKFIIDLSTASCNKQLNVKKIFEHTPLIIPSKSAGKVYVFSNLILDSISLSELKNVCWVIFSDSLETFNTIKREKPNSWQPFYRAWQKIKRYEEISVARALIRYTNIEEELSHDKVIDLANAYIELIKPLELQYAEKPQDYINMFSDKGVDTCMTLHPSKREIWSELLKHDHHPMSLFAYHPKIQGVYCVKEGKVMARALLYNISSKVYKYGRIFSVTRFYNERFSLLLDEQGYKPLSNRFEQKITIKIPGLYSEHFKDWILPVPYMDNISRYMHGEFDNNKKQFSLTFSCKNSEANVSTGATGGFIKSQDLHYSICSVCGNTCNNRHVPWNEPSLAFCCSACCIIAGYVYAKIADGGMQLRQRCDCYIDFFSKDTYFSNQNSCRKNGGITVIHDVIVGDNKEITEIRTEPKEVSAFSHVVTYRECRYAISNDLWKLLKVGNHFSSGHTLKYVQGDLL